MDNLRWLLLFFGILVIAGVYVYSRRDWRGAKKETPDKHRIAPIVGAERDEPVAEQQEQPDVEADRSLEGVPQKIITLRLVARHGGTFAGDDLILSMRGIGLRHGKFGIFHRIDGDNENRMIFSAASLVEPGSFDLANIKDQEIPGISLFMVLPGPIDGVEAFDMMMDAARAVSQALGGELLDETGSTLSIQRERYLREEIIQYQHSHLVA